MCQQAKNFDLVVLNEGVIPFNVFKGYKVLLSFYGSPDCKACKLKYQDRARQACLLKDSLFLLSVFRDKRGKYNWISREKYMINLFDPKGKIYNLYCVESDTAQHVPDDAQNSQQQHCDRSADFMIDKNFMISKIGYPASQQHGLSMVEITSFASS